MPSAAPKLSPPGWVCVPDNRISGGKVRKARTRKVISRVAAALRLAAQSLRQSENKLAEYCRRMKARLGKAEGLTATAHKLARILYAVITRRVPYDEEGARIHKVSATWRRGKAAGRRGLGFGGTKGGGGWA